MEKSVLELLAQAWAWGTKKFTAPPRHDKYTKLEIYTHSEDGDQPIATLECHDGKFIFRYHENYDGHAISAFPRIDKEYESKDLWPFFSVRIPPLKREDVSREIIEKQIGEDQIIELLATVAKSSATNPYQFRLATVGGAISVDEQTESPLNVARTPVKHGRIHTRRFR